MAKDRAKPCPFCGYTEIHLTEVYHTNLPVQYQRWCDRCGAMTREAYGKAMA
jgi:hypothetical protein